MRVALLLSSVLLLGACKGGGDRSKSESGAEASAGAKRAPAADPQAVKPELGAHASASCQEAMAALTKLDAVLARGEPFETALVRDAWGRVHPWVRDAGRELGRDDATVLDESVTRIENLDDPAARRRELVLFVTQARTVALLEARRLLTRASDADPGQTPVLERARDWDQAWCMWDGALRPLARRADALPKRGGEDWEDTIVAAFEDGRSKLDDPVAPKASRQIIEKGSYAVAYRLILADAEDLGGERAAPAASEAAAMLDMLEDRLADRNGLGLARMRRMLNGDPAAVDSTVVERELAVAFTKRARKYCDKAVVHAELGSPGAIAETWEGVVYTKVILPSMREALSDAGFDADAYMADWHSYLEAVEAGDAETAAAISPRLVEWNCAYQDRLGIAACTATANEPE